MKDTNDPKRVMLARGGELGILNVSAWMAGKPDADPNDVIRVPELVLMAATIDRMLWTRDAAFTEALRDCVPVLIRVTANAEARLKMRVMLADVACREIAPDALDSAGNRPLAEFLRGMPQTTAECASASADVLENISKSVSRDKAPRAEFNAVSHAACSLRCVVDGDSRAASHAAHAAEWAAMSASDALGDAALNAGHTARAIAWQASKAADLAKQISLLAVDTVRAFDEMASTASNASDACSKALAASMDASQANDRKLGRWCNRLMEVALQCCNQQEETRGT